MNTKLYRLAGILILSLFLVPSVQAAPVFVKDTVVVPITRQIEKIVPQGMELNAANAQNPLITDTPVEITVRTYSWMVTGNNGVVAPQLRAWNAQYPNVKLDLQVMDDWTGILAQDIQAGTAPDIVYSGSPYNYAKQGSILDLTPYFDIKALEQDTLPEYWKNEMFIDGKLYGIWQDTEARVVYYRKDLAEKAGLQPPQNGWTYAEMRDFAKQLTTPDMSGICIGNEAWPWLAMSVADGAKWGTDTTFAIDPVKNMYQFLSDMIKDKSAPSAQTGLTRDQCFDLFAQGKTAMVFLHNNGISPLLRGDLKGAVNGEQIGVVSLPVAQSGQKFVSWGGGWAWWIIQKDYEDLKKSYLIDLLKYVTSKNSQVEYALKWGFMLPRISYMNEIKRLVKEDASVQADPLASFWSTWLDIAANNIHGDPANPIQFPWAIGLSKGAEVIQAGGTVDAAVQEAQKYYDANKP